MALVATLRKRLLLEGKSACVDKLQVRMKLMASSQLLQTCSKPARGQR